MKLFVSFEGIEASGKSTLITYLVDLLSKRGITSSVKPEFAISSEHFNKIDNALERSIFLSEGFEDGSLPSFFFMLYAETVSLLHADHTCDVLFADRYLDSIAIYQGYFACKNDEHFDVVSLLTILEVLFRKLDIPIPNLTLLLQAPFEVISKRFHQREKRSLTSEELRKIILFHSLYNDIAKSRSRYYIIDSTREIESLIEDVFSIIVGKLQYLGG